MDAKQIAQIDRQKASQAEQRKAVSNQHSDQGFALLAQALQAPTLGEQKPFLLQAFDAFGEGIRFQRSNPEPYVGFAYVLMLIGNNESALDYVKEVQRLQPDHADVELLLGELQRRTSIKQAKTRAATSPPAPAMPVAIDYDALYDQLELDIMSAVRSLMNAPLVEAKPSIEAAHIAGLEQQIQAINKRLADFERQLQILDQEIDIVELSLKLKPIEGMLRRFQKALQVSGTLTALCQDMTTQLRLMIETLRETRLSKDPEDVPIVEENLEVFLDRIDSFANCLDELEAQGFDIEVGLQRYNKLLAVVEDLQDALEELKI